MLSGPCSGDRHTPAAESTLRVIGAIAGIGGGGYGGYALAANAETYFTVMAVLIGAGFGRQLGVALGKGVYNAGCTLFKKDAQEDNAQVEKGMSNVDEKSSLLESSTAPSV